MASSQYKIEKIVNFSTDATSKDISVGLPYAYAACLKKTEIIKVLFLSLENRNLRSLVRVRIKRDAENERNCSVFSQCADDLLELDRKDKKARRQIWTYLSYMYVMLTPEVRERILIRWRDSGTKAGFSRWLKAIETDEFHFNYDELLCLWRERQQLGAAVLFAKRAPREALQKALPELVAMSENGWPISVAVRRCPDLEEQIWEKILELHPNTYLYLRAKLKLPVQDNIAINIVRNCCSNSPDNLGLMIWCLGQLNLWDVIQAIEDEAVELELVIAKAKGYYWLL